MAWSNRLYFGTWQFGGQFKNLSPAEIESLLSFAVTQGIRRFDTAAVYGDGKVERILGTCLPEDAVIVTKIPATSGPSLEAPLPIEKCYSREYIHSGVQESLERLRRDSVDTVLLHNWLPTWTSETAVAVLRYLAELKERGWTRRIGISLPKNFSAAIPETVLSPIDVIECPFNPEQTWILPQLPHLLSLKKEILLRSLFKQGKLITDQNPAEAIVRSTLALGTSVVIGMTTEKQITQNIKFVKGVVT